MILADKILNLRKKNGWSQDEFAEKLNVSRQSVSKWEGALSIPDISKIIEMANLFEVSTDYLLKDEMEMPDFAPDKSACSDGAVKISLQEANALMSASENYSRKTALGVALCVLSPLVLFILVALYGMGGLVNEGVAVGIGVACILVFVAGAVSIFILNGEHSKKLEKLSKSDLSLEYGVDGIVREKRSAFNKIYTICLVLGVSLFILCVVPYMVAIVLNAAEYVYLFLVAGMLALIAVGVALIVFVSCKKGLYDLLLQEEEYEPKNRSANKTVEKVAGVYWPIVVAIYLAWSFIGNSWNISWTVWPIAGVLFGAVSAFLKRGK